MKYLKKIYFGIIHHPRFYTMIPVGVMIGLITHTTTDWKWSTITLISWNIAVIFYLMCTFTQLKGDQQQHIIRRAKKQDEGKWTILLLVFIALIMCLCAILVNLSHIPAQSDIKYARVALSIFTIMSTWFFVHTIFAIHYAHDFYVAYQKHQETGLEFPKTQKPTYSDFIYFSYVIGTASQTADVSITSSKMRRLNTLHLLFAFAYNTLILAICINIAASLLS
ncbi:DUF1345 domain-containing protein [Acinetobacter sp. B10A]|uniref:DUF1345 domain-containing protein n=1 Tax=Acinetobacter baretiae TaxID=2605383 RepID=UPI001B3C566C|nr:DUF1345 domain-containing protein [Acinetobacter baretiae]MBF7685760.1 DUF1345 domain-containing protein [Acinetobacter baretiae]